MKRNDLLWKAALEDFFDDFLRFFYPEAESIFDLDRGFEYLDKELEQLFPNPDDGSQLYVDKLVKVFTKDGVEGWILVHIEVQGYTDHNFAKRMYQYYYRISDKYNKPVTAFAIFTDGSKTFHPKRYEQDFLGTKLYYTFNTWKILNQDDQALERSENPFAMVLLTAKLAIDSKTFSEQTLYEQAFVLAKRLLNKQMPKQKVRALMNFLRYYVRFENQEMIIKFDQEITTLTQGGKPMGIEEFLLDSAKKEGIKEGREEGIEEGIKKTALKMKQSGLDVILISQITGLSADEISDL